MDGSNKIQPRQNLLLWKQSETKKELQAAEALQSNLAVSIVQELSADADVDLSMLLMRCYFYTRVQFAVY